LSSGFDRGGILGIIHTAEFIAKFLSPHASEGLIALPRILTHIGFAESDRFELLPGRLSVDEMDEVKADRTGSETVPPEANYRRTRRHLSSRV